MPSGLSCLWFSSLAVFVFALLACSETSGPAVAVNLNLHSVDGIVVPVQLRTPGGRLVTLANGKLQGTSWGYACGAGFRLAEGPITALDIPSCRLTSGIERKFTITFTDSRFPAGQHEYRFVP